MLVVTLGHLNHPGESNKHAHWNWPILGSAYFPGADLAYLRCEDAGLACLTENGIGTDYDLSPGRLYALASRRNLFDDPIPNNQRIDVEAVSWAVETAGRESRNEGWVQDMDTVRAPREPTYAFADGRLTLDDKALAPVEGRGFVEQLKDQGDDKVFVGWATDTVGVAAATKIVVFADGVEVGSAKPQIGRPDVASAVGPGGASAGYTVAVDRADLQSARSIRLVEIIETPGKTGWAELTIPPAVAKALRE